MKLKRYVKPVSQVIEIPMHMLIFLVTLVIVVVLLLLVAFTIKEDPEKTLKRFKNIVKIAKDEIVFDKPLLLEYGSLLYARMLTPYGTTHTYVKWRSWRTRIQSTRIHTESICSKPPHISVTSRGVFVEVPAARVIEGDMKKILLACFNTKSVKARADLNLTYSSGYVKVITTISRGVIETKTEWITYEPFIEKELAEYTLIVELCSKKHNACTELLKLSKPGISKIAVKYPEVVKLVIGHEEGVGFEELGKLAMEMPAVFGIGDADVHVVVKSKFKRIAETRSTLMSP